VNAAWHLCPHLNRPAQDLINDASKASSGAQFDALIKLLFALNSVKSDLARIVHELPQVGVQL
jgi:hypothetical protein